MAAVALKNIKKSFGGTSVIQGISLDIEDGEFLTLVGPSGCGKTTLLRIIAGLEDQSEGEVHIDRVAVGGQAPKERDVAMVFQSYALYPYMTVAENMAVPLVMRRLNGWQRLPWIGRWLPGTRALRAQIDQAVNEVAGNLDIGHLLARKPVQLSGGQRQRVALGRAIVRHPKVFLMDEPLSNLDAQLRVQTRAEIAQLHRRLGVTFVYVTHDQAEAMTMSDRVAVIMDGALLQLAPPQQVYSDPGHLKVAQFIGSPKINVIPGTVTAEGAVEALGARLPLGVALEAGRDVAVGVRAEALGLAEGAGAGWSGTVRHGENLGADYLAYVDLPGLAEPLIVRLDPQRVAVPALGSTVAVAPMLERVLLFGADGRRLATGRGVLQEAVGG